MNGKSARLEGRLLGLLLAVCGWLTFTTLAIADSVVPTSREQISLSYAPLVKSTAPAVVNIYTKTVVKQRRTNPLFSDPFFKKFFGENFGLQFGQPKERVQNSLGSGVIVDADGTVVTNNHVIEGADQIRVVLTDRREFDAEIVGVDERTDLAVLRIATEGERFPFLTFANSDVLEVGDLVLAIGNPFGVGQTVTSGIVSALARTQAGVADIGSFIQTDAAINPGNSGGALVGMDGHLVGVNTAIYSNTGGSLGIGFAVPANLVRFVIDGMGPDGRVIRPWLGAWGQTVNSDIAESLGLERPEGVLVSELWPGSAADRAGVDRGDVILGINGNSITNPQDLEFRFSTLPIGNEASLSVLSAEGIRSVSVSLEPASEEPNPDTIRIDGRNPLSGLTIANMSPALGDELKLDRFSPGVTVLNVARGTPAGRLRFRALDRLVSINGEGISRVADVYAQLDQDRREWEIVIDRNGKQLSMVIGP